MIARTDLAGKLPGIAQSAARLLSGHSVAWLAGAGGEPSLFMVGDKRLGTFGSLPVRGGSGPVECCLPLVLEHVANPIRCRRVVQARGTLVRLGRMAERLRTGGQNLCDGSVRLHRVAPGRCQPLAGGGAPAIADLQAPFSKRLKPRADGVKPGVDLLPTVQRELGLAVHVP